MLRYDRTRTRSRISSRTCTQKYVRARSTYFRKVRVLVLLPHRSASTSTTTILVLVLEFVILPTLCQLPGEEISGTFEKYEYD